MIDNGQVLRDESNLLSGLLFNPKIIPEINLRSDDFLEGRMGPNGLIFQTIWGIFNDGQNPNDPQMLYGRLVDILRHSNMNGETIMAKIGGQKTLVDLVNNGGIHVANIPHYSAKVREASTKRKLDQLASDVVATDNLDEKQQLLKEAVELEIQNTGFKFGGVDASELEKFAGDQVDWLVEYVFGSDQPTVFGARSKGGKTTQLADLAVSLATQTDWLGYFIIPKRRRVLFITGEANNRAISKRIQKALAARNLTFSDVAEFLRVEAVDFPQLPNVRHQNEIRRIVERYGLDVVIVDPLYRGLNGLDTNKLADIGPAIVEFAKAVEPASLIISHHTTKAAAFVYGEPPELEDMSGAGIAESCGNWYLLGRNEAYQADGLHDLCVRYGGRDEQAGLKRILFNENDWTFEVSSLSDHRETLKDEKQKAKSKANQQKILDAENEIKRALRLEKVPMSKTSIRDKCSESARGHHRTAVANLIKDGSLVERPYTDSCKRNQNGWLLRDHVEQFDKQQAEKDTQNETEKDAA